MNTLISLNAIGASMRDWQDRNFPNHDKMRGMVQLSEETGEVARALGKETDGIRYETRGDLADELADVILAASALAARCRVDLDHRVYERQQRALTLNFRMYPENGRDK